MTELEASFSWGVCCVRCDQVRDMYFITKTQWLQGRRVWTLESPCHCGSRGAYVRMGRTEVRIVGYVEPDDQEPASGPRTA